VAQKTESIKVTRDAAEDIPGADARGEPEEVELWTHREENGNATFTYKKASTMSTVVVE
jgi:hypothetical protein